MEKPWELTPEELVTIDNDVTSRAYEAQGSFIMDIQNATSRAAQRKLMEYLIAKSIDMGDWVEMEIPTWDTLLKEFGLE